MNPVVAEFNKGFGNCIFMNRDASSVAKTIMEKSDKAFSEIPSGIKVTPVDDLHDKLSLTLKDNVIEGTLTWRKSAIGVHYVLTGLE